MLLRSSKPGNASVPATTPWGTNSEAVNVNDEEPNAKGLSIAVLAAGAFY
jgi:hypothetical protein